MELPRLDDATRATIEQFIADIEAADFHSRQFNVVLPELLMEALRIEQEAHHDESE
jgi:hypothetical protein